MAVIKLTGETGAITEIETAVFLRMRAILNSERQLHNANTRIDHAFISYVKEQPEAVAALIAATPEQRRTLASLTMLNGQPLWFNGEKAQGPLPIPDSVRQSGARSGVKIGQKVQYVLNTHQEVAEVIGATEGDRLPIPGEGFDARIPEAPPQVTPPAPDAVWDPNIPTS
jgi:hypothetical protein